MIILQITYIFLFLCKGWGSEIIHTPYDKDNTL